MKFLHTSGSFGFAGGMAALMMLLHNAPEVGTPEYASLRAGLDFLSGWLILPSMTLVLFSGVMAMAVHFPFHNAGWVWAKFASGILVFEATFASVDAPAARAAKATQLALEGQISQAELLGQIDDKWIAWWILLALAAVNVVLAIWRPRFMRRSRAKAPT